MSGSKKTLSQGESVEVAQKDGESASGEALPEGWAEAPLGEVVEIWDNLREPVNAKERATRQGPYPYYGANGQAGTIDGFRFDGDYALIAEDGGNFEEPEKGVAYRVTGQFWVNNHAHVLKGSCGMTSAFLVHLLNSMDWMPFVSGTTRLKLNQGKLKSAPLKVPPKAEQSRIVSAIESLQERSSRVRVLLSEVGPLIGQLRQSVLRDAFSGKLTADWRAQRARERHGASRRPDDADHSDNATNPRLAPCGSQDDQATNPAQETASDLLLRIRTERRERWQSQQLAKYEAKGKQPPKNWQDKYKEPEPVDESELPELPDGWCWTSIGEVFEVHVGATPRRKEPAYWDGDVPWVSSGEVAFCRIYGTKETITQEGLNNTSTDLHQPGTILLGMIGEGKTRGQAAILEIEACNNQNSAAIRVSNTPIPPEYVYHHLVRVYEETREAGSGNNQPALNKSRVQALTIPIAPLEVQRVICEQVEQVMEQLESVLAVQASMESSLTQLDQSILSKASEASWSLRTRQRNQPPNS